MKKFGFFEIVFLGPYSEWSYKDESNDNYCEYTPFMFAFVLLIFQSGFSDAKYLIVVNKNRQRNYTSILFHVFN